MSSYLESVRKEFLQYKKLATLAMDQLNEEQLFYQANEESNSISIIVQHMSGNMLSRFSDFLTTDGEKPWRNRDEEFALSTGRRQELLVQWEKGWECLLNTLASLNDNDLEKIVYIRNDGHTVVEAINRQLAHYSSHAGQIIFIAKMLKGKEWISLSIPRNQSSAFNDKKFSEERGRRHFTDRQ